MWSILFAAIIVIAAVRRVRSMGAWSDFPVDFDLVFVFLYLAAMLAELRISGRDADTEGKTASDAGTLQLYGSAQALTILTALWFPAAWHSPCGAHFIGFFLFLAGGCYRQWAIHSLGSFYSHKVRVADRLRIVVAGPYRFTRHPAYAGMVVANAGVLVYFFNWVTLTVFSLLLLPAMVLRIVIEERALFRISGYAEYAARRKRLFPALW